LTYKRLIGYGGLLKDPQGTEFRRRWKRGFG